MLSFNKKKSCALLLAIIFTAAFSACTKNNGYAGKPSAESYDDVKEYEYSIDDSVLNENLYINEPSGGTEAAETFSKTIKTGNINLETKSFAALTENIPGLMDKYGGYIESSNMYYYEQRNLRRISYTLRIPAEYFNSVWDTLLKMGYVTGSTASESDVTERYYDISARLDAKESEEGRLLELIAQAKDLSDLVLLEQRLSSVRTDIEIYRAQQTGIDRKAAFSTIWLYVSEVEDIYSTQTLWDRVKKSFYDSVDGVVYFFQGALVFAVSAVIPVLLAAAVLFIGIKVFRRLSRRRKTKLSYAKSKTSIDNKAKNVVKSLIEDVKKSKDYKE